MGETRGQALDGRMRAEGATAAARANDWKRGRRCAASPTERGGPCALKPPALHPGALSSPPIHRTGPAPGHAGSTVA